MQAVNAAIERLDKRANDPRAHAFGFATDLQVIANALRELRDSRSATVEALELVNDILKDQVEALRVVRQYVEARR